MWDDSQRMQLVWEQLADSGVKSRKAAPVKREMLRQSLVVLFSSFCLLWRHVWSTLCNATCAFVFLVNVHQNIKHSLTVPVSFLEASWARCLSAQAHWHRTAAATVTIGVLWWVLRCRDIEGGVAGIHSVALGVHWWVTQEVIRHWRLCCRRERQEVASLKPSPSGKCCLFSIWIILTCTFVFCYVRIDHISKMLFGERWYT